MEIIVTSIIAFASTNIDDLFILTLFFGDKKSNATNIYLGQYLGIITLIVLSMAGSLLGHFMDSRYIGLLGLFPIYLGVKQLIGLLKNENEAASAENEKQDVKTGILTIATVTIANGGDNIGTYIPLLTALTPADRAIMIFIFLLMVFIWLTMARYLSNHPVLAKGIEKYGHIITPVVLCLLGLFILKENGSFDLLSHLK